MKGFTLIEAVIVIVIVSITAITTFPLFRATFRRTYAKEGTALLTAVATSEKRYFSDHNAYLAVANTGYSRVLDIDARTNQYFRSFQVTAGGSGRVTASFTATTTGTGYAGGITVTYTQDSIQAGGADSLVPNGI